MPHPLLPQIEQLADAAIAPLGLHVVAVAVLAHKRPTVIRVDIRNPEAHTGLDDCERASRAIEAALDREDLIPHAYLLEVSSPGIERQLSSDREFTAFRGFTVTAIAREPYQGKERWTGQLIGREGGNIILNQKGKRLEIPEEFVLSVELT